MNHRIT